MVSESIRQRFLRDPLKVRLGNLASDLARIASFSENPENYEVVVSVLEEAKCFVRWAASEESHEKQSLLTDIQRLVSEWERGWLAGCPVSTMHDEAIRKSKELLVIAGYEYE